MQDHPAPPCDQSIEPPPTDAPAQAGARGFGWDARVWGALVVLCGVLLLSGLGVPVALPSFRDGPGLSPSQLQWVASGYVLGIGGLLLLGGRTVAGPVNDRRAPRVQTEAWAP